MRRLQIDRVTTPIGEALLVADGGRLCALEFEGSEERLARSLALRYGQVELAETSDPCGFGAAIRAYFAGELRAIDTIP
ncbi:MAG: hypothetical protein RLZZ387_205, partial [Chloroflexota bacterium]